MGGESKIYKQNQQLAQQQQALQREMFAASQKPTPEQERFRKGQSNFDAWIKKGDFRSAPEGSILNFDLYNPSKINDQQQKLANLTGVGAANMGGTGDQSVALQLTRERNANQAAEMSGRAWENAIKGEDDYYKSNGLAWSGQDRANNMGLLNNASQSAQAYMQNAIQTRPTSPWASIIGGALGIGASALSGGMAPGGFFNR